MAPQHGGATLPSGGGTQKGMPKVKELLLVLLCLGVIFVLFILVHDGEFLVGF